MARGFSTRIEEDGGANLQLARKTAAQIKETGANLIPFMEDARTILIASINRRFEGGKGPDGIPWEPSRRALGLVKGKPSGKTLVDTGDLQGSITGAVGADYVEVGVGAGSSGQGRAVKAHANQYGSQREDVYVRQHTRRQTYAFGAPIAEPKTVTVAEHYRVTNLPARPFIGIDEEDAREVLTAWRERIQATVGK